MSDLLVGFDSAWTPTNEGAIVAALRRDSGNYEELGDPQSVSFPAAANLVREWQRKLEPRTTLILLDQPTLVPNERGQRPVENLVGAPVSLRYGGVQPASRSRVEMFGDAAPLWPFLEQFGGAANPLAPVGTTHVIETYPVLALSALGWLRDDSRPTGRLPKYNPERRKTFSIDDWKFVCHQLRDSLRTVGLWRTAQWTAQASTLMTPRKRDQDALDACLCLLIAALIADGQECLMAGDLETGYMIVPYGAVLHAELEKRCRLTARDPNAWVRSYRFEQAR